MASVIKLKRSLTPGSVPGSLEAGELAINIPDKKLFSSNGSNVFNVSGDQYNLTSSAVDSGAAVTLTVDNEALSNDSIELLGGTGITVTRNANSSITLTSGSVAGSIDTDAIQDGAVTAAKIANQGLGANTLAAGAVTTAKIADAQITAAKIAAAGLSTNTLANFAVTTAKLDNASITSEKIATDAVTSNTIADNAVTLGTHTTGDYVGSLVAGQDIVLTNNSGEGATPTVGLNDGIAANTSGTAATASALTSAVTVSLTGDVTGSATFTNGGDTASIATTIAADSVALGTDTTGNYVASITGTANEIEVTGSGSETAAVTVGLPDNVTVSDNLTVSENLTVSGNTTINGNLDVNGTLTYINSTTVTIGDNMLKLANTNTTDTVDMGFYSRFNDGSEKFTGLVRDATDGAYTLFTDLATEPDQTINFGSATTATLNAVIDGGTY
jgi:hypothetical protein